MMIRESDTSGLATRNVIVVRPNRRDPSVNCFFNKIYAGSEMDPTIAFRTTPVVDSKFNS